MGPKVFAPTFEVNTCGCPFGPGWNVVMASDVVVWLSAARRKLLGSGNSDAGGVHGPAAVPLLTGCSRSKPVLSSYRPVSPANTPGLWRPAVVYWSPVLDDATVPVIAPVAWSKVSTELSDWPLAVVWF